MVMMLDYKSIIKIAGFQNVRLYDGSIIDWASKRLSIEY